MSSFDGGQVNLWHPDEARAAADFYPPGEAAVPVDLTGMTRWWLDPTYGWQKLELRYNSSGSSIANKVMTEKAVSSSRSVTVASGADIPCNKMGGVVRPTTIVDGAVVAAGIPTLYYFWAVMQGNTLCLSNAAIAQGAEIAVDANTGKVDDNAFSGGNLFGRWLAADPGGADVSGLCEINLGHVS